MIGCWLFRENKNRRGFFSSWSYSSSTTSSRSSNINKIHLHKPIDQFSVLTSSFPQGDAFTSVTNMTPRSSFDQRLISSNIDINNQQIFGQTPRPSYSKSSSIAQFYPGIPLNSIVPNPVFVTKQSNNENFINQEKLITSIYVTNSGQNKDTNEQYYN